MITHLAICGGGVKGCVLLGALEALDNIIRFNRIKHIIGSSVGGIIATLLCIGYRPCEMNDIFLKINLTDYRNIKATNIITKYGVDNCKSIITLLKACILQKITVWDVTFRELYAYNGMTLILTGTDISNSKTIYYNVETTPDMIVMDALRITISYPILYEPVYDPIHKSYLIDGAVLAQYPINYFKDINTKVGICLDLNTNKRVISNIMSYINALINSIIDNSIESSIKKYRKDTILINIPDDIHALDFQLDYNKKREIRRHGYKSASRFIKHRVNKYYKKKLLRKCFNSLRDY
tara:strand:- start:155 stop:1039 length:885 start_codon:yes stop_codon:yes gene_type:complete